MEQHIDIETDQQQDKGFTLVELLIVIVILGILATVTVFAVRGITDQGKTSACEADLKTIQVAAEAYMAQEGTYPASLAAMESEGFLRDASSTNWTYAFVAGPPVDFTVTATAGGPCV